jgi:hypothetical protein
MTKRPSLKALDTRPSAPAPIFALDPDEPKKLRPQQGRVGKKVMTVYLEESVWRDLKVLAAKTDTTLDALAKEGLDLIFEKHGVNRGAAG